MGSAGHATRHAAPRLRHAASARHAPTAGLCRTAAWLEAAPKHASAPAAPVGVDSSNAYKSSELFWGVKVLDIRVGNEVRTSCLVSAKQGLTPITALSQLSGRSCGIAGLTCVGSN